ncbi:uncharacterized protein BCR38DRAFT_407827 [Pseudomassariella vexata]|uniref:Uncharacterized protein n=1 Tax=Pseudomassariella vexata TaxID=1141098 RepID=A0A1Y2E2T8_9PEZI|nr:uncharacterized protein BCR38DRAFT_407827 [Pseudomassariella vexata]ORY65819.1 hypothetical protein BCR38DRAFT_407827 [Pseudomassariella vexata]
MHMLETPGACAFKQRTMCASPWASILTNTICQKPIVIEIAFVTTRHLTRAATEPPIRGSNQPSYAWPLFYSSLRKETMGMCYSERIASICKECDEVLWRGHPKYNKCLQVLRDKRRFGSCGSANQITNTTPTALCRKCRKASVDHESRVSWDKCYRSRLWCFG